MERWIERRRLMKLFPSLAPGHQLYPWHVLLVVMLGTFLVVLDGTIVNIAIPTITLVFGELLHQVIWIVTAYLIALSAVLAISAWVCDRIGPKNAYLLGILIFFFSSYLCGIAWNLSSLIAFRVLQGIGGGILIPVGMILFINEFKEEKRNVALGVYSIAVAAAISLGPSIGGYLLEYNSWRFIFFINLPFSIFIFFYGGILLKRVWVKKKYPFDASGFITFVGFLVFLFIGISSGNAPWNVEGWFSRLTLGSFFISTLLLTLFSYFQLTAVHPLIDLTIFKNKNFLIGNVILFIFSFTLFGSSFLLPLYLQNGLQYSQVDTGLILLPLGVAQGIFGGISGWLLKKISPNFVILVSIFILGLTYQINSHFNLDTTASMMMLLFFIRGAAMGLLFAPLVAVSLSTIPEKDISQATGIFTIQRQIGAALGVAVFETFFIFRSAYHEAAFGAVMHQSSPLLEQFRERVSNKLMSLVEPSFLIVEAVKKRVFVQAIADDLFFAGIITFFSCTPLMFSFFQFFWQKKK